MEQVNLILNIPVNLHELQFVLSLSFIISIVYLIHTESYFVGHSVFLRIIRSCHITCQPMLVNSTDAAVTHAGGHQITP